MPREALGQATDTARQRAGPFQPKVQRGRLTVYSEPWSGTSTMAEIFMLRLEAAARAAKEATSPFVPITWPAAKAS